MRIDRYLPQLNRIFRQNIQKQFITFLFGFSLMSGYSQVTFTVASSSDDAEERLSDGDVLLTSSDLEFMSDVPAAHDVQNWVGLRFTNVNIPQGASITNAYLEFTVDESAYTTNTNLEIFADSVSNSSTFQATDFNISSRSRTASSVNWNALPQWTPVGSTEQSPDVSSVLQEIVDMDDWSSGNAVSFLITGSGKRTAESFDGTAAPSLVVEFSVVTLPIDLLYFSGEAVLDESQAYIELSWETATEVNNHFFTIEKSVDGKVFYSVAQVMGAGNSWHNRKYTYKDSELSNEIAYYKLKQTDFDGSFSYSKPIIINTDFNLNPVQVENPVKDYLRLSYNSSSEQSTINCRINSLDGELIYSFEHEVTDGKSNIQLNVNHLESGMYFLSVFEQYSQPIYRRKILIL